MTGVALVVELTNFKAVEALLTRLENFDASDLFTNIAAQGTMQTQRRIEEEKTAPDGTAWPPNREGGSILFRSGEHLRDSIASSSTATGAEWGSSWEYAHVHQDGMVITPANGKALKFWFLKGGFNGNPALSGVEFAVVKQVTIHKREFVGLSEANGREIVEVTTDYLGSLVR